MNILAFSPFSTMYGGANRSFLMVLKGLKEYHNHKIYVVVPEQGQLTEELSKIEIQWCVIPFHRIHGVNSISVKTMLSLVKQSLYSIQDSKKASMIAAEYADKNIDLIYINDCAAAIGGYVAKRMKRPYVWHFRSNISSREMGAWGIRRLYRDCTSIITISEVMKNNLEHSKYAPLENVKKILNGIPLEETEQVACYDDNEIHMLMCGRIAADKGHKDAIEALSILRNKIGKKLYLHIVGDVLKSESRKVYLEGLKDLIEKLDLNKWIIFEGQIDDMIKFREKMNIELVCSICEPFGRVTIEGMRSGLVVIGSNTGGTKEIIQDGVTGFLYKQGNPQDLADKIQMVLSSPELYKKISDNAFSYSKNHFTDKENIEAINLLLNDIL